MELSFTDMIKFGDPYTVSNAYFHREAAPRAASRITETPGRVAEALGQMKSAIEQNGWIQGNTGMPGYGFCMQGAYSYRSGMATYYEHMSPLGLATAAALARAIAAQGEADPRSMSDWDRVIAFNDTKGRLKSEVLAVIDDAIAATDPNTEPEAVPAPEQTPVTAPVPEFTPGQFLGFQEEIDKLMKVSQLVSAGE